MKKIFLLLFSICILTACMACGVDMGGESSDTESISINAENEWSDENVDDNGWV